MTTPDHNQQPNPDQPYSNPNWAPTSAYPPPVADAWVNPPAPTGGYPSVDYPPNSYPAPVYGQSGYPPAGYTPPPYGQAPYGQPFAPGYPAGPSNGLGTAGLVCGIIAVVFCWTFYGGWILGILAICFGGVGLGRAKRGEANNRGAAMAGVVLGIVAIVIPILLIIVGIGLFATAVSNTTYG